MNDEFNEEMKQEEYILKFFGSTSNELRKEVSTLFLNAVNHGIHSFSSYVSHEYAAANKIKNLSEEEKQKVQNVTKKYQDEFTKDIKKNLDNIEQYVTQKIFKIPEHVLLPADKIHEKVAVSAESSDELDLEITHLIDRLKALRYMEASLEQELSEAKKVVPETAKLVEYCESFKDVCFPLPEIQPLENEVKNAQAQVDAALSYSDNYNHDDSTWSVLDGNDTPPSSQSRCDD